MKRLLAYLPLFTTIFIGCLLLAYGPIAQPSRYHEFADQSVLMGLPHAADVLSNIGFAIIAMWGMCRLWPMREHVSISAGWHGHRLFLIGLFFTALGSGFYHLAPDNARLVWDRLPIALACAGLLAAVRAEVVPNADGKMSAALLSIFAVISVGWWYITDQYGVGDLRPYLFLQGLPLILIPMWQTIYRAPALDRVTFGAALLLYIAAKIVEIYDHQLQSIFGVISGHTIKHLLATVAASVLIIRLVHRVQKPCALQSKPCLMEKSL